MDKTYIAIDLKSFFASVECCYRGLDPLGVNLVVADASRTEKTICLAVSPSLKAYGIAGRSRLYEVVQKVRDVNRQRSFALPGRQFRGKSFVDAELKRDPSLAVDYIVAKPQMGLYMKVSSAVFDIYSKYVSPEDIHVYSVDEVFIDATQYLRKYNLTAREFATKLIHAVLDKTGITATAGIGPNMYLCKIAMDIEAKHITADKFGVRIAELDEMSYRQKYWDHKPLTDFWRVGKGIAARLEASGIYTMGDVARTSVDNEETLYQMLGVGAELLIDHAWGFESTTIADIKAYKPSTNSISSGQVLQRPYPYDKAKMIVREMTENLVLELVDKRIKTDRIDLNVVYDVTNLRNGYDGAVQKDFYGRQMPKSANGGMSLQEYTNSSMIIVDSMMKVYERIVNPELTVRKIYVVANRIKHESTIEKKETYEEIDMFADTSKLEEKAEKEKVLLEKEKQRQETILEIRKKYGKNAMFKASSLQKDSTARERNGMVGGHKK